MRNKSNGGMSESKTSAFRQTFLSRLEGSFRLTTPSMIERRAFYDSRATFRLQEGRRYYHHLLRRHFGFLVPPDVNVLEVGCGLGDLLAAVRPARGVGVDFSSPIIELARQRHPELEFQVAESTEFSTDETFDYILLSDLVNDVPDVQG